MRIRRFVESNVVDISPDRVIEINEYLSTLNSDINQKCEKIESILNEMDNYKSQSKSNNDQIDDSIANLQIIRKSLADVTDKVDSVISNLTDYNKDGRKFIY